MTHASVFSGIGGPEVAATMLGWENLFHCEINPFGRAVLDYWYPNSKSYEDITKTDFTEWRGRVNVLTGGFPCQPFSYAEQRRGATERIFIEMVIGNGFFTETRQNAVAEMAARSKCKVEHCPFPTIGNIDYYISEKGDLYGLQNIQGKQLTRLKKPVKNKHGYMARMSTAPHKEVWVPLCTLVYCSFTLKRWEPDIELEYKNGNQYDCTSDNLQPKQQEQHPEWTETMEQRQEAYAKEFMRICYSTTFYVGIPMEDSKDVVSQTFIELCTTGNNPSIHDVNEFIGLWVKQSRKRAIDFYHRYGKRFDMECYDTLLEIRGKEDAPFEHDLFHIQPGTKRALYLRMWAEGNTPTEIARECGCTLATVSSSISRSIQFLQRYFKKEL